MYEMESIETTTSTGNSWKSCLISTATEAAMETLGQMGHVFANLYGKSVMKFETDIFLAKMKYYRKLNLGIILCANEMTDQGMELRGAIAGIINESVFDGGKTASELFWYVWPGAPKGTGTQLLEAFEQWAKSRGCVRVSMAHMVHNENGLGSFYEKKGYSAFETHYLKEL
jgi:GNAT superfamily N-acetyltransferase